MDNFKTYVNKYIGHIISNPSEQDLQDILTLCKRYRSFSEKTDKSKDYYVSHSKVINGVKIKCVALGEAKLLEYGFSKSSSSRGGGKCSNYTGVKLTSQYSTGKSTGGMKMWQAILSIPKRKSIYLGCFNTENEAAIAYNAAAKKYLGEGAFQNIIIDDAKHNQLNPLNKAVQKGYKTWFPESKEECIDRIKNYELANKMSKSAQEGHDAIINYLNGDDRLLLSLMTKKYYRLYYDLIIKWENKHGKKYIKRKSLELDLTAKDFIQEGILHIMNRVE